LAQQAIANADANIRRVKASLVAMQASVVTLEETAAQKRKVRRKTDKGPSE
jgi:hypothetical protein